jgi:hypothetical protein
MYVFPAPEDPLKLILITDKKKMKLAGYTGAGRSTVGTPIAVEKSPLSLIQNSKPPFIPGGLSASVIQ